MSAERSKKVEENLRGMARDPFRFDALVDSWNALFDEEEAHTQHAAAVDQAIDQAFAAIAEEGTNDVISPHVRRLINALPHPAIVVRTDGLIAAMNDAALDRLQCDPGDNVEQIGYALEQGSDLSDVIRRALDRRNESSSFLVKRAFHEASDRSASLAILTTREDRFECALVFVIDPVWREEVQAFLSRVYGLTTAELEILMGFLDGDSLHDIARRRERSHRTVRTQFQTILSKTGASSRAALMRNTFALSQFVVDIAPVAEVARHPHRKRFDFYGKNGRAIDVTLTGDLSGPLIVSIPDMTQYLLPPDVEAAFLKGGICVAFLCRPGTGKTDPVPPDQDYLTCLADDICAVLDQLDRPRTVLLTNNMSSIFGFRLGGLIPDRLSRVVITSTQLPEPQHDVSYTRSPWARALISAARKSPSMYRLMIHSAIRGWKALGSRRMLLMQLRGFEPDMQQAKRPEVIAAFDEAINTILSQGTDQALLVFQYAAQDWSDWVRTCQVPIELIQGCHDPSSSLPAVEAFAETHKDRITLHKISDAGYFTLLTHTELMVQKLSTYAREVCS